MVFLILKLVSLNICSSYLLIWSYWRFTNKTFWDNLHSGFLLGILWNRISYFQLWAVLQMRNYNLPFQGNYPLDMYARSFQTWSLFLTCACWNLFPSMARCVLGRGFIFVVDIPIALLPCLRLAHLPRNCSGVSCLRVYHSRCGSCHALSWS